MVVSCRDGGVPSEVARVFVIGGGIERRRADGGAGGRRAIAYGLFKTLDRRAEVSAKTTHTLCAEEHQHDCQNDE
jgi:hypothetical protein